MTEFPTMVYRVPGKFKAPGGGTYDFHGADDKAEFDRLLKAGWYPTVKAAQLGGEVIKTADALEEALDDMTPATRAELEQKAKELGIRGVHLMKDETLAKKIAERV